ncbi:hypothetical protein D3C87_1802480 [compost metagenome]
MPLKTEGHGLDQGRASSIAGTFYSLTGYVPHGDGVITIDSYTGHRVTCRTIGNPCAGCTIFITRMLGKAVVLANEHHR